MTEENKFTTSKTSIDNPFLKYRSVKYKVTHTSIKKNSKTIDAPCVEKKLYQTGRQSWRKPTSYSQHRKANSSLTNPVMPEEDLKASYLSTWDQLLTSSEKARVVERVQSKFEMLRVHLPSIVNFEPSKFTSLDPLFLPFEDIERGIQELKAALPLPKKQMTQIHHEMAEFQAKIMNDLEDTEKQGMRELKRLRNMLRTDSVQYQGQHMRLKRQSISLNHEYQSFKSSFQSTKSRLDVLQDEIFSSRPFNLTHNVNFEQQFPQSYF